MNFVEDNMQTCKQLNEVSRCAKLVKFHEVSKICKQLYEVRRIRQQFYRIRKFPEQLYEVCGTLKKLQTTLQRSWDTLITFGTSLSPAKTL